MLRKILVIVVLFGGILFQNFIPFIEFTSAESAKERVTAAQAAFDRELENDEYCTQDPCLDAEAELTSANKAAGTKASGSAPKVNCYGLPGCVDGGKKPSPANVSQNLGAEVLTSIIGQAIQFVAAIAVIALIISGIMYMISGGEEEKTKKAKTWIIWSLVGVFVSISAWGIINMINNINIG